MKWQSLVILALLAAGCAEVPIEPEWPELHADTRGLAEKYPHDSAVILRRDDRVQVELDGSGFRCLLEHYDAIAVLNEGGEKYAEIVVPLGRGKLSFLQARVTSPDGVVHQLRPEEVHEATARAAGASEDIRIQIFRLPDVRAGSIIEYLYSLSNERGLIADRRRVSGELPIAQYHLDMAATDNIDFGVRLYNGKSGMQKWAENHVQHIAFELHDIPAYRQERFSPPWTATEPYWAMRVTAMGDPYGNPYLNFFAYKDWPHTVLREYGYRLYLRNDNFYRDVKLRPNLDGCAGDRRCAASRALELVASKTELSQFVTGLHAARSLKEALASGTANNFEKALLLKGALDSAGVAARFVLLARHPENDFDLDFAMPGRFDHLLVQLDEQPGVPAPLLVDPSCEACALGELPSWDQGRKALAFTTRSVGGSERESETRVGIFEAQREAAVAASSRRDIAARIEPTGTLSGSITVEESGDFGLERRLETRTWLPERWRKELQISLQHHHKLAELTTEPAPPSWDRRKGVFRFAADYRVPGYAAVDGDQLIVPLTFLHATCDEDLGHEPRRHDVLFPTPSHEEETLTFHLPSGFSISEVPPPISVHTATLDAAVIVAAANDSVMIRRTLDRHSGLWTRDRWDELVAASRRVAAIRQSALVLKKKS